MKDLRRLNFEELITVGVPDVARYTFDEYARNGEHTSINRYCISCDEIGCHIAADDESYQLTNISHGAHSSDFVRALGSLRDRSDWHQQPIMFIYESPSLDYDIYREVVFQGHRKRPSKFWYWIPHNEQLTGYPQRFTGGEYGRFVLSAILTFKLANVYITNLVKCSLNNKEGRFRGLSSFKAETVKNCYSRFLEREISMVNPAVIFAVGSAVERWVKWFIRDSYYVQQLPHPAGRRRGFRDEHYKAIYFWGVTRALHKARIINTDEGAELARLYLDRYDDSLDRA